MEADNHKEEPRCPICKSKDIKLSISAIDERHDEIYYGLHCNECGHEETD